MFVSFITIFTYKYCDFFVAVISMQTLLSPRKPIPHYQGLVYKSPITSYHHFVNAFVHYYNCTHGPTDKKVSMERANERWATAKLLPKSSLDALINTYSGAQEQWKQHQSGNILLFQPLYAPQQSSTIPTTSISIASITSVPITPTTSVPITSKSNVSNNNTPRTPTIDRLSSLLKRKREEVEATQKDIQQLESIVLGDGGQIIAQKKLKLDEATDEIKALTKDIKGLQQRNKRQQAYRANCKKVRGVLSLLLCHFETYNIQRGKRKVLLVAQNYSLLALSSLL